MTPSQAPVACGGAGSPISAILIEAIFERRDILLAPTAMAQVRSYNEWIHAWYMYSIMTIVSLIWFHLVFSRSTRFCVLRPSDMNGCHRTLSNDWRLIVPETRKHHCMLLMLVPLSEIPCVCVRSDVYFIDDLELLLQSMFSACMISHLYISWALFVFYDVYVNVHCL